MCAHVEGEKARQRVREDLKCEENIFDIYNNR